MRLSRMTKIAGKPKGIYLSFFKKIKKNPIPIFIPIFGKIKTYYEILNIDHNFVLEALRDMKIENYLKKKTNPCIIDCGVNVGITIRWWYYLNGNAKIFGIDMHKDALDFTAKVLKENSIENKTKVCDFNPIKSLLYNKDNVEFKISKKDTLHGNNSIFKDSATSDYEVILSETLDSIFKNKKIEQVDLLKVDIEGAGGFALEGAVNLLKKTKNILFEAHDENECKLAGKILAEHGFLLRRVVMDQLWWEKA